VAYLLEALLFLLPFAAYGLWRRANPDTEPSTILLVLGAVGIVLMVAGSFWYGTQRSMPRGTAYVPAQIEGGQITPGHAEPVR